MKPKLLQPARAATVAGLCSLALLSPSMAAGQGGTTACFDGDPAVPIDPSRTPPGQATVEMWPADLRPADPQGQPLPAGRDSTQYTGFQRLGERDGLEFFYDLDIEESAGGTYLYMAYNSGLQIWDIGASPADPQLLAQRDGWEGDFHNFQNTHTELYLLIFGIDALDPPGAPGQTLIALAGKSPVGLTLWDASDKSNPTQLYQDEGKAGIQVAAANIGGRSYAFFGSGSGVEVYDMTRAREVGACFESTSSAVNLCGTNQNPVWRGRLDPWPWGRVEYLDVLEAEISGQTKHFIATSDAFFFNGLGVEIREITGAASLPPTSTPLIQGLDTLSFGVDLFEYGGRQYLGAVSFTDLEIHDVTACLSASAGCSLATPEFGPLTTATDGDLPALSFVQYSESNGRPFLYKGFSASCSVPPAAGGPNQEVLLDVSGLATGDPVVDIRGEEYLDPNHSSPQRRIDYWSSYYDKSTAGFSAVAPHAGKFHGTYFYRAAQSIFDIHEWTGDVPPAAEIQAISSDRWLSAPGVPEWVSLSGECTVGADTGWSWNASNALGEPVADPAPVLEPLGGSLARVRGDLCVADAYPAAVCPDRTVSIEADVLCEATPLTSNQLSLTLRDPRPFFDSISILETPEVAGPPPSFPVCQALNFQALSGAVPQIRGKELASYTWEITPVGGGETLSCTSTVASTGLACTETTLAWDTVGVDAGLSTFIFSDGFESGNTSRWSSKGAVGSGVTFDVVLTADNGIGSLARTTQVALTPLENLAFTGDGFTVPATPPAAGLYDFTATAVSATSFRWELEQDPALAGDAGCLHVTPCQIVTSTSAQLEYRWPTGNVDGADYEVWLEIANCDVGLPPLPISRLVENVVVTPAVPPTISSFNVVEGAGCACHPAGCACPVGEVSFTVAFAGDCSALSFDWGDGTTSPDLPCGQATYQHSFLSTGVFTLQAEACAGPDLCDIQVNLTNISPTSPKPLTIQ